MNYYLVAAFITLHKSAVSWARQTVEMSLAQNSSPRPSKVYLCLDQPLLREDLVVLSTIYELITIEQRGPSALPAIAPSFVCSFLARDQAGMSERISSRDNSFFPSIWHREVYIGFDSVLREFMWLKTCWCLYFGEMCWFEKTADGLPRGHTKQIF